MLPFKINKKEISLDAQLRLKAFFLNFCRGNNGSGDHLGHLIMACQMAFPLVLSPKLSNLLWLNFGNYPFKFGTKRIEYVTVSDILLSSLCRPIAGKQYEMLPEIRSYLLYTLFDNKWLSDNGIKTFGRTRLNSIANFIAQFLTESQYKNESDWKNFQQLNGWAVMAFSDPKNFTLSIGKELKKSLEEQHVGETEQLRLNLIINRFNDQLSLNIYQGDDSGHTGFANLKKFSSANRLRLFGGSPREVSNALSTVRKFFFKEELMAGDSVQLPIFGADHARIRRRKSGIRRVFTVFIQVDEDTYGYYANGTSGANLWNNFRSHIAKRKDMQLEGDLVLVGREATFRNFKNALEQVYQSANPEDHVVLCYQNSPGLDKSDSMRLYDDSGELVSYGAESLNTIIGKYQGNNRPELLLLLDGYVHRRSRLLELADVVLSRISKTNEAQRPADLLKDICEVLDATGVLPSYRDLMLLLRFKDETRLGSSSDRAQAETLLRSRLSSESVFLSNKSWRRKTSTHLLAHDFDAKRWVVLEQDLVDIQVNTDISVYEYASGDHVASSGEMFYRDGFILANGNFDALSPGAVYLIEARGEALGFEIFPASNAPEIKRMENLLFRRIEKGKFNYFRQYQRFDEDWSSEYRKAEDRVTLDLGRNTDDEMLLRFFLNDGYANSKLSFAFETADVKLVKLALAQFNQYTYLLRLSPRRYRSSDSSSPTARFSWANGESRNFGDDGDGYLRVAPECYFVKNGKISLRDLTIDLKGRKSANEHIAVYLLLPNFAVVRLYQTRAGKFGDELPGTGELTIDLNPFVELILDYPNQIVVKVLISAYPIEQDFSQKGVDKIMLRKVNDNE